MSTLRERLAGFERNIVDNEKFGCVSSSFLCNVVNLRKAKTADGVDRTMHGGDLQDPTNFTKFYEAPGADDTSVTMDMTEFEDFEDDDETLGEVSAGSSISFSEHLESQCEFIDDLIEISDYQEENHAESQPETCNIVGFKNEPAMAVTSVDVVVDRSLMETWDSTLIRIARETRKPQLSCEGKCLKDRLKAFE